VIFCKVLLLELGGWKLASIITQIKL